MKMTTFDFLKRSLSTPRFILYFTLLNMVLYHYPLYSYALSNLTLSLSGLLTLLTLLIGLFIGISLLLFLVALISSLALKAFSIFIVIGNAIAVYFIISYDVILDRTMMGNVFNTNIAEATSYYHPKVFLYLFVLGILPAFIIAQIKIEKVKRLRLLVQGVVTLLIAFVVLYLNAGSWLWLDKHAKKIGGMILPSAYIGNALRYQARLWEHSKKQILLPSATLENNKSQIVVLVIGESARAANFSLLGYDRPTNPQLSQLGVTAVEATAATTYTTASIHSMLSATGSTSDDYEPLPSYLQRHGIDVIWRSNNWGEPKINVATYERDSDLRKSCQGASCAFDDVLLTKLSHRIKTSKKEKIFIVLHTYGSHGPTYYKKYPKTFEQFKPVCQTVDLKTCTQQELINAYDNTVLYTDHFLGRVIKLLQEHADRPSLFIYASDHGESLGEYGLYLHGTPFVIAPDMQKKVPFIFWASPAYLQDKGLSSLQTAVGKPYTHHHIFHTVMGAFGLHSAVYDPKLDIFK